MINYDPEIMTDLQSSFKAALMNAAEINDVPHAISRLRSRRDIQRMRIQRLLLKPLDKFATIRMRFGYDPREFEKAVDHYDPASGLWWSPMLNFFTSMDVLRPTYRFDLEIKTKLFVVDGETYSTDQFWSPEGDLRDMVRIPIRAYMDKDQVTVFLNSYHVGANSMDLLPFREDLLEWVCIDIMQKISSPNAYEVKRG